jgi:hypothetical protein
MDSVWAVVGEYSNRHPCINPPAGIKRGVGLGDIVAKITSAVGIKPCKGCKGRQALLNKIRW